MYEEGGGKGWELTFCLRKDLLWSMGIGQPYSNFNLADFKRTKNLGSSLSLSPFATRDAFGIVRDRFWPKLILTV
jgi:hypothetical protein